MRRIWTGLGLSGFGVALYFVPARLGMIGLVLAGYGFLCLADWFIEKRGWRRGWRVAVKVVGVAFFLILASGSAYVIAQGQSQWDEVREVDYAVVLGARIREDQPSRTLRERLDAALRFMEENPDAAVIVSGGKGTDERASEASVMYRYLADHGAEMSRVHVEDQARNTRENLKYSAAMAAELGLDPDRPAVITSEFHQCRARYIAGTLGMEISSVSSETEPWYVLVNGALREVLAFVKAWFVAAAES